MKDRHILEFGHLRYDLSRRTHIMGILNCTPDSFYDGGQFSDPSSAVDHALRMIEEGADFIDVGGESTRPGSVPVSPEEEIRRVLPVVRALAKAANTPVSIDTTKAEVARQALDAGAEIVNDISGFTFEPEIADIVAGRGVPVILMHTLGRPAVMQENPRYSNLIEDICAALGTAVRNAESKGIQHIIVDPGIGFGKTVANNCEIIRRLNEFRRFRYPVMTGVSRKGFIGRILDLPLEERLEGTLAAVAASIMNGASIVRVHDVKPAVRVARVIDAIMRE